MEQLLKIFIGFLSKTLNLTDEQVSALLYKESDDPDNKELRDDVIDELLKLDTERVKTLKEGALSEEDKTKLRDEGYKRAQSEVMTDFEKKLATKFGSDSKEKGLKLVEQIISAAVKAGTDDDKIKSHPLYLSLENEMNSQIDTLKTDHQTAIDELNAKHARNGILSTVKDHARQILAGMNPVISQNAVVAKNRESDFLNKLEQFDFELDANGGMGHLIKVDGKRLENDQGHHIKFEDKVKELASLYYDFKAQNPKGTPGGGDDDPPAVTVPKTQQEYDKAIYNAKTDEERLELNKAWEASQTT